MTFSRRTTRIAAIAGAAAFALIATGCSSSSTPASTGSSTDPITLTVSTFGTMGYDDLYKQYEADHPNITIKATNIDTGDNAKTDWQTKEAAGSGLPDVQAVEEGWLSAVMQVSDQFNDLSKYGANDIKDRWVDWKLKQATDKNGRIIGYGSDIGPEGLCYNKTDFAAAGLPTDRDAVATLFGGSSATWDDYFKVGAQYKAATGKAFYDQSGFLWNAMVNQQKEGYYKADGTLNVDGNADLKALWTKLSAATSSGLSANQTAWDWGKGKAFTDGTFSTFVCPGWMLGVVKGQVTSAGGDASTGWDFANVFPGGAANWGGSFLTVPTQSKHPQEAADLAAFLTDAKSQAAAFGVAGTFPSVTAAQTDPAVTGTNALSTFFNNAPIGQILADRAKGVVAQFKGPDDSVIQSQVFGPSIQEIDSGKADGATAWNDAITLLNQLVVNK
ncbi:ABC transporter substrate-binding protein [Subtercola sp. PAMC28395]|uniref:ABC transporter substrate-binding protein n=1 Tax=Subtercola sp. PAMC28395 TaxID=2846775 RepID=UPI001C0CE8F6|nr:ABC transporter substrate-binding protein [Subtercola sp. PAMC28395]QWT24109.1 ABC transporter substrate-binding protein [Subtercola sp. PAMC28395]